MSSPEEQIQQLRQHLQAITAERAELLARVEALIEERRAVRAQIDHAVASRTRERTLADELSKVRQHLEEARQSVATTERLYAELRSRRVVRLGLALAATLRPFFGFMRWARRRVRGARGPSPAADVRHPVPGAVVSADQLARMRAAAMPTVIIPVFNAPEAVDRCLAAVVRNTPADACVLVIDDASTDRRIADILARYASDRMRLLSNPENLGFVRTVNRGIGETSTDVVILNSDTEVTPGWLDNMRVAAYADPRVATVTPFSDNAGAFSAPEGGVVNDLPAGPAHDDIGRAVTRHSRRLYPDGPTGNGFCMYIKRDLLGMVGAFDPHAFPRDYGAENDLCMRALRAGWRNVIDDATYVFHEKGGSFGSERERLLEVGRRKLDELHPDYGRLVQQFLGSDVLAEGRRAVREAFAHLRRFPTVKTRILFVIHEGSGGTSATNRDLMCSLQSDYETFVLRSDANRLTLHRFDLEGVWELESFQLRPPVRITEESRVDYQEYVAGLLIRHAIELVHVRHLLQHTFDLPRVARTLGIPVVLSLHDFYLCCPTVHLLDERDRFCGGVCSPGEGACRLPVQWLTDVPPLKHAWVFSWRERVRRLVADVDAVVTTSEATRAVYVASYPELAGARFEIIEHGRELSQSRLATTPLPDGPIRILVPGNLNVHKGGDFVRRLREFDGGKRLEFHFIGDVPNEYKTLGAWHGTYGRQAFPEMVQRIRPSFVGLFSIWAETYSHTLTEAWAAGIPVLASRLGALGERVRRHGGGWLVDTDDPVLTVDLIRRIAADPAEYARVAAEIDVSRLRTTRDMAADYDGLYRSVLERRCGRPGETFAAARRPAHGSRGSLLSASGGGRAASLGGARRALDGTSA